MTENKTDERKAQAEVKRKKKLAEEICADFEDRREKRRRLESGWLLNMNFFSGNQYCDVSPIGGVQEEDKQYYWQSRRAFNHIAPAVEARIAKLTRLRPTLKARAFSDEDGDLRAAKLASGILSFVKERVGLNDIVSRATLWAEICGSAFYKVAWDCTGGRQVGLDGGNLPVYEGEVNITAVSPFEMYPDSLSVESLEEVQSLIHAKTVPVSYIAETFGVCLEGRSAEERAAVYSEPSAAKDGVKGIRTAAQENVEILIERYTRPNGNYKEGKLEIAAGGELLYEGPLPYVNEEKGERGFPFVKQDCMRLPAAFFGESVVDRLIPVQRAYNAVRNRKHELLNKISMGVIAVEDGSVDTDELAEEGLSPGKILIYRQGGKAPEMVDTGDVPNEFAREEEWLEKEFAYVSGVSELSKNSMPTQVTSATGLKLLFSEDNARLSATIDHLSEAMKELAKQIVLLYRQFAGSARLLTMTGENRKTEIFYFNAAELSPSDLVFDAEQTISQEERQETIMKLLNVGLFADENGKISTATKHKILDAFGFGDYENARDISALHIIKAEEENVELMRNSVAVDGYDDHELHIVEHTRFLLSGEYKKRENSALKERVCEHIAEHEKRKKKWTTFSE